MPFSEAIDNRSTLSAPNQPSGNNEDVPDFTTFKLEGFKMNSSTEINPSPHRLREARRSLVLFLEPNPGTPIQTSFQTFQEKTIIQFGPNQAHNTPLHISILGRVLIERGSDFSTKWETVEEFVEVLDEEIARHKLKAPNFTSFEILDKPTRSLVINVRVSSDYHNLGKAIEQRMASKCTALEVSPMNKIHLAYNVLKSISRPALKNLKEKAESTIDIYDWVKTGGSWRLSLYEVMLESQVVGVQQQLTEIRSWPIQPKSQDSFASNLPVSLRIKLAFLSSWFKSSSFLPKKPAPPPVQPTNAMVIRRRAPQQTF
ncbi:uncharacterized protein EV154DRAFT_526060 [Mucor mucedo]|uniref:uncharacterized protein n=1 Tax=Mucor mucedo TaxID=29922 RepID=UPI002220D9DF|nr:uncharacterized protein EV154DRAFT_526060 [Mucor mucedo]KAI7876298.1 hypothetical protein EV154DRAFT_526060 [Mucor mucedo]